MPRMGKAEPHIDKPSTDHSELILIDMRSEGIIPNVKIPKPSEAATCKRVSLTMLHVSPRRGK